MERRTSASRSRRQRLGPDHRHHLDSPGGEPGQRHAVSGRERPVLGTGHEPDRVRARKAPSPFLPRRVPEHPEPLDAPLEPADPLGRERLGIRALHVHRPRHAPWRHSPGRWPPPVFPPASAGGAHRPGRPGPPPAGRWRPPRPSGPRSTRNRDAPGAAGPAQPADLHLRGSHVVEAHPAEPAGAADDLRQLARQHAPLVRVREPLGQERHRLRRRRARDPGRSPAPAPAPRGTSPAPVPRTAPPGRRPARSPAATARACSRPRGGPRCRAATPRPPRRAATRRSGSARRD